MDKQTLRHKLLVERDALTPTQTQADSALICQHLANWPLFQAAQTVLAYLAFRNEISLQSLLDRHPEKLWALPRTLRGGRLVIHHYQPGRLARHPWGIPEPAADAPLVPLEEIDLVLVPGVGFDGHGGRLGFGGGYYDRLLSQMNGVRVGIVHRASYVPAVPCDEYDIRMDWLDRPDGLTRVAGWIS